MENFKITREGKYDVTLNVKLKLRNIVNKRLIAIDTFFEKY